MAINLFNLISIMIVKVGVDIEDNHYLNQLVEMEDIPDHGMEDKETKDQTMEDILDHGMENRKI